jgi:hypothetical protein
LDGEIQKALIDLGILYNRFGFSMDRENERFFRFLRSFMNFAGCAGRWPWLVCLFLGSRLKDLLAASLRLAFAQGPPG